MITNATRLLQLPLSASERSTLRRLVAVMIPASAQYNVPGADDGAIFADILRSIKRDREQVGHALRCLHDLAGAAFPGLPADEQLAVIERFRRDQPEMANLLVSITVRCYYRDDRVMRSIGMEPRPPFPKGFEVEQGDWSLLDPVRAGPRIYR